MFVFAYSLDQYGDDLTYLNESFDADICMFRGTSALGKPSIATSLLFFIRLVLYSLVIVFYAFGRVLPSHCCTDFVKIIQLGQEFLWLCNCVSKSNV